MIDFNWCIYTAEALERLKYFIIFLAVLGSTTVVLYAFFSSVEYGRVTKATKLLLVTIPIMVLITILFPSKSVMFAARQSCVVGYGG